MEFLYDRDMPEYIKKMSKEQLEKEIAILESMPKISKNDTSENKIGGSSTTDKILLM